MFPPARRRVTDRNAPAVKVTFSIVRHLAVIARSLLLLILVGANLPVGVKAQAEPNPANTPQPAPADNAQFSQHLYLPVVATQGDTTAGLISAANYYGGGGGGGGGFGGEPDCGSPGEQLNLPATDDETFVGYKKNFLGQQATPACVCRSQGPIEISIPINRYVGEVSPVPLEGDSSIAPFFGPLVDLPTLLQNQVVAPSARLDIAVWDVDSNWGEEDQAALNGYPLTTPEYIQGANDEWSIMSYEVPVEYLYFPLYRGGGLLQSSLPVPATNRLQIDVNTGSGSWCMAADWASLHIEAMAPVLFVHGTAADSSTWDSVVDYLTTNRIPFDRDISLIANGSIEINAEKLSGIVYKKAQSFGTQSVHLITHSKGGLDSRGYLSNEYHPEQVRVLSLNTLSGAHQGIVLADIMTARHEEAAWANLDTDPDIYSYLNSWDFMKPAPFLPDFPAVSDQQTTTMARFNQKNFIPAGVKFYTYSADADHNNDGLIDAAEVEGFVPWPLNERPLTNFSQSQATIVYNILRTVSGIKTVPATYNCPPNYPCERFDNLPDIRSVDIVSIRPVDFNQDNDLVVAEYSTNHPQQTAHYGPFNGTHSTIKRNDIIELVLNNIRQAFPLGQ